MAAATSSMVKALLGGNITPHDMPPLLPRHQMESDDVWDVKAELFDGEVTPLAVENCNAAVVSTWRRRHHHPKFARLPHVNSVGESRLL